MMLPPEGWGEREKARKQIVRAHAEIMRSVLQQIAALGYGGAAGMAQKCLRLIDEQIERAGASEPTDRVN